MLPRSGKHWWCEKIINKHQLKTPKRTRSRGRHGLPFGTIDKCQGLNVGMYLCVHRKLSRNVERGVHISIWNFVYDSLHGRNQRIKSWNEDKMVLTTWSLSCEGSGPFNSHFAIPVCGHLADYVKLRLLWIELKSYSCNRVFAFSRFTQTRHNAVWSCDTGDYDSDRPSSATFSFGQNRQVIFLHAAKRN